MARSYYDDYESDMIDNARSRESPRDRQYALMERQDRALIDQARAKGGRPAELGTALKLGIQSGLSRTIDETGDALNAVAGPIGRFFSAATFNGGQGTPSARQQPSTGITAAQDQNTSAGTTASVSQQQPEPAAATQTAGSPDTRRTSWDFGEQGKATLHTGADGKPLMGFDERAQAMERARQGANIGYDPQDARQAQASPYYRQIGANTYMNDRGLMIQGNQADADYMYRFRSAGSTPVWTPAPQQQQAQQQMPMPERPKGGWKTQIRAYQADMDAYNKAQDRAKALDIARMQDERAANQLGFQQEQARQQQALQEAHLGLAMDQNAMNRTKAAVEQGMAALGLKQQQSLYGAQQNLLNAYASGDAQAIKDAERAYRMLSGGKEDAGRKGGRYRPVTEEYVNPDGTTGKRTLVLDTDTGNFKESQNGGNNGMTEYVNNLVAGLGPEQKKAWDKAKPEVRAQLIAAQIMDQWGKNGGW